MMINGGAPLICGHRIIGGALDGISAVSQWKNYHPAVATNGSTSLEVDDGDGVIIQIDGKTQHTYLSPELEQKDIYFADMHTAIKERGDLIRDYFMTKAVTLETTLKSGNIATRKHV